MTNNKTIKSLQWVVLLVGIVCIGVSVTVGLSITVAPSEHVYSQYLLRLFRDVPVVVSFLFIGILMPIVEELAFRGWHLQRKIMKVISLLLMLAFFYGLFQNLLLLVVIDVVLLALLFTKPSLTKKMILIFFTSIIFGCAHYSNYDHAAIGLVSVFQTTGIALVLHYLAWRFNILVAIAVHIANNCIVFAIIHNTPLQTVTMELSGATIEQTTFNSLMPPDSTFFRSSDTLLEFKGDGKSFIYAYINTYLRHDSFAYRTDKSIGNTVALNIQSKSINNISKTLLDTLSTLLYVDIDTVEQSFYNVRLLDNAPVVSEQKIKTEREYAVMSLAYFKGHLDINYGISLINYAEDSAIFIQLPTKLLYIKDSEEIDFKAYENIGVLIEASITQKRKSIVIKNKATL